MRLESAWLGSLYYICNHMSSFLFLLCITSGLFYALQSALMSRYYRSIERLSVVAYRGLSIGITMCPLLLFVPDGTLSRISSANVFLIFIAALLSSYAVTQCAKTYSYLPVGIANALLVSSSTVVAWLYGVVFFSEVLTLRHVAVTLALFFCLGMLGWLQRSGRAGDGALDPGTDVRLGVISAGLYGITLGSSLPLLAVVSRTVNPVIAGYFWEFGIGILATIGCLLRRYVFRGDGLQRISVVLFSKVMLSASPTVIATGLYAYAMTFGPIGIITALTSVQIVFCAILSQYIHKELLTRAQWVSMFLSCVCLFLLRY